jgi:hypothetical protein
MLPPSIVAGLTLKLLMLAEPEVVKTALLVVAEDSVTPEMVN